MKNETFYFSHDYNARNDRKILKLRQKAKLPGLAIFWCLIEMMYEDGGKIPLADIPTIANELRAKISQVESVVNDFGLFKKDSEHFWSESVKRRIDKRLEKSEKARESIRKRWRNTDAIRTNNDSNTIKERKGKENKGKEIEERTPTEILRDRQFVDVCLMNWGITETALTKMLTDFFAANQGKKWKDYPDCKGHFYSWGKFNNKYIGYQSAKKQMVH